MKKKIEEIKEAMIFSIDAFGQNTEQIKKAINLLEDLEKQFSLNGVSHLLIAWEQYKKANWWESDSVDVEHYLRGQFAAIYCG